MKTLLASLALLAIGALPLSAAAADTTAPSAAPAAARADYSACKADIAKLCPGIEPGAGRLKGCFKDHRKEFSSECKSEMAAARKAKKGQ